MPYLLIQYEGSSASGPTISDSSAKTPQGLSIVSVQGATESQRPGSSIVVGEVCSQSFGLLPHVRVTKCVLSANVHVCRLGLVREAL